MKVVGHNIQCGILFEGANAEFVQFAFARSASIDIKQEMKEISSPDTGTTKSYIVGRKSWSMSCGCLLSSDITSENRINIWQIYNEGWRVDVRWGLADGKKFKGKAYIKSLKATGNIHDMATFDIDLQGTGPLTYE